MAADNKLPQGFILLTLAEGESLLLRKASVLDAVGRSDSDKAKNWPQAHTLVRAMGSTSYIRETLEEITEMLRADWQIIVGRNAEKKEEASG